jgi:FlaG/FlaF family flagellin (archaellin)
MKFKTKKQVMGPVISVFVMVLIISILAGLTFLFIAQLKNNVETTAGTAGASGSGQNSTSWQAVNKTEAAGYTIVSYLPLIFLAIIFGALLTLVLKIILPYINLGQSIGGF